jgi:hypothetical protein
MSASSILSKSMTKMNPKFYKKIKKSYNKSMNCMEPKICFSNVECPLCCSNLAYIGWHKDFTAGYCPECNEEWLEP